MHVYDFLPEFIDVLKAQLVEDEKRWGDTWLQRTHAGQDDRLAKSLRDYCDEFQYDDVPLPLLKIAGNALINWIRNTHPEFWEK